MNDPVKIEIVNGKPSVTSLQIAEAFGKSHKNVLADIRVTIAKCSESFTGLNFQLSGYKDSTGRNLPMYLLTKDGLLMVTMGYTTPEAMQVKEAYIARFNEMEEQIKHAVALPNFNDPVEAARAWADKEEQRRIEERAKLMALETIEAQKPLVQIAETRIDTKGCFSITDVNRSLGLKRGPITRWAKSQGFIHQRLTEVNNAGLKYFKIYSTDGIHNQIGVTKEGVLLIKKILLGE